MEEFRAEIMDPTGPSPLQTQLARLSQLLVPQRNNANQTQGLGWVHEWESGFEEAKQLLEYEWQVLAAPPAVTQQFRANYFTSMSKNNLLHILNEIGKWNERRAKVVDVLRCIVQIEAVMEELDHLFEGSFSLEVAEERLHQLRNLHTQCVTAIYDAKESFGYLRSFIFHGVPYLHTIQQHVRTVQKRLARFIPRMNNTAWNSLNSAPSTNSPCTPRSPLASPPPLASTPHQTHSTSPVPCPETQSQSGCSEAELAAHLLLQDIHREAQLMERILTPGRSDNVSSGLKADAAVALEFEKSRNARHPYRLSLKHIKHRRRIDNPHPHLPSSSPSHRTNQPKNHVFMNYAASRVTSSFLYRSTT
eukprot:TRINITY_DN1688_c0_g1_i8.p1 TRINITY_DN1688_c0_g1~~TRINITY_DN1688_c0_g1_i8.p1  ORF type:complete len:362 (+),score=69.65 TRINITY_DN1688_c0_g1_i8:229-1314(+)